MTRYDYTPIIPKIQKVIDTHKLADGSYGRFLGDTEPNPYGCADAANILYSIGNFPQDPAERAASCVDGAIRGSSCKRNGRFPEGKLRKGLYKRGIFTPLGKAFRPWRQLPDHPLRPWPYPPSPHVVGAKFLAFVRVVCPIPYLRRAHSARPLLSARLQLVRT